MTNERMFAILGFETARHRMLAKLFTEPEVAAGHEDAAAALEQAVALLVGGKNVQPKRVAVQKCSRSGLRKGGVSFRNDAKAL